MSSTLRNLTIVAFTGALAAFAAGCASEANSKVCPTTGIVCPEDTICAAAQAVCLVSSCGNGIPDPGEQCDDGNIIDGDRCSSLCRTETCGNGIQDVGEECDPAPGNTEAGDGCSPTCTIEICGNGRTDFGEACDDGDEKNGDGCSGMSVEFSDGQGGTVMSPGPCESTEICGNGKVDYQVGEVCDDGNVINEDGCNSDCKSGTGCGNGIRELDEECDDGNDTDTDRCLNDCTLSQCGDGVIETGRETCDAGDRDNRGPVETADCNIDCTISTCGDRRVNTTDDEECDAGVFGNGDDKNCTLACKFNFCGDGKKDTQVPNVEACDDGNMNPSDGCNNSCQLASCGNSTVDVGEECDDGDDPQNPNNNDGCVQCKFAECGDGWVRTDVPGEECDGDGAGTGDSIAGDGCFACKIERCGNSIVDFGEQCDDGETPVNDPPSTTASPNATLPENTDACVNALGTAQCKNARCGDGYLRDTEDCDDGNNINGDGCSASCENEGCGNGILEIVRGEQCDDNNTMGGDGCSATCQLEDCGDGFMDVGEECDGNNMGVGGETATCNADCTLVECGDGKINNAAMEQCDDGTVSGVNQNQNNRDCRADCRLNFCTDGFQNTQGSPGKLEACDDGNMVATDGCNNQCQLASCGNGLIDPMEECDLGMANNDNGACTTGCKIAVCGDGKLRTGIEECDPGESALNNDGSCLAGTGPTHIGGCRFARCGDGSVQNSSRDSGNNPIDEDCDAGSANTTPALGNCPYGAPSCSLCSSVTCKPFTQNDPARTQYCGDSTTDGGEQCDNGANNGIVNCSYGQTSCTVCTAACTSTAGRTHYCGDGVRDTAALTGFGNEACDDGDNDNETMSDCGGYNTSCLFCNSGCTGTISFTGPHCGDNMCNGPENNMTCPGDCDSVCGNNIRENNEQCDNDTAPADGGDGCSSSCTVEYGYTCTGAEGVGSTCMTTCGDGKKAASEACDDGNLNNNDGCSNMCAIEGGWSCNHPQASFSVCTRDMNCGDGFIGTGEVCDYGSGNNNGVDCPNGSPPGYGLNNACVACMSCTMFVVSADYCGDSSINGSEQCESGMLNGATCSSVPPFDDGTLACNASTCTFNTSSCTDCGNNIRETGEACDDGDGGGDGCNGSCTVESGFFCTGNVGMPSTCQAFATCSMLTGGSGDIGDACNDNAFYDRGDGVDIACPCSTAGGLTNNMCTGDTPSMAGTCACTPTCGATGTPDGCGGTCP